jgi:hypothetical protein
VAKYKHPAVNGAAPRPEPEEIEPLSDQAQEVIEDEPERVIDTSPPAPPEILPHISRDAEMDNATLTCWNGTRFVSWKDYMWEQLCANAGRPITDEERRRFAKEKRRLRNQP